jgi:mannose-1-phosphate guanylyltransferase
MSRQRQPKQLIPLFAGKSLLRIAYERLEGLVDAPRRYICAAEQHRATILAALAELSPAQLLCEPVGRDTLAAVGFSAAVLAKGDPDAVVGVFTADHLIEPRDQFQAVVRQGFELAERSAERLVTFGVAPTAAATSYGYLELGEPVDGYARQVRRLQEKPDATPAREYLAAGPEHYLWNSGMFVWRAATLLECIRRYEPDCRAGLSRIAAAWGEADQAAVLAKVYTAMRKVSVDVAVMERAAADPTLEVAAVPMPLTWLDVGSWPMFAKTCPRDDRGNARGPGRHVFVDSKDTLSASSDPRHLIAAVGCEDLLIVHTPDVTLVCRADRAEDIKRLHAMIAEQFGGEYL